MIGLADDAPKASNFHCVRENKGDVLSKTLAQESTVILLFQQPSFYPKFEKIPSPILLEIYTVRMVNVSCNLHQKLYPIK